MSVNRKTLRCAASQRAELHYVAAMDEAVRWLKGPVSFPGEGDRCVVLQSVASHRVVPSSVT